MAKHPPEPNSSDQPSSPPPVGVDPTINLAERLAFLNLDDEDAQRLRSLAEPFESLASHFVERFYSHLFSFQPTSAFLRDPVLVERLKGMQREYFSQLLQAEWDKEYVETRCAVGRVHADVGVEPQWFLGAYNQFVQFWVQQLAESAPPGERENYARLGSMLKAVLLDVGLTLDRYFLESTHKLRRALDLYWRANEELRQFAQITSHDLKTPLATVANYCEEALDEFGDQMPSEACELIEAAKSRAYRMSTTIDELLTSAIYSARSDSNHQISSQECVNQAVEQLTHLINSDQIELHVDDDLPPVIGNAVRFREVFVNLLSNAVKYRDKKHGRISITSRRRDGMQVFCVADNGPGIPREEQLKIFAPFRRLREHRKIPGSGVGLYFAKMMVEQQGGQMWVESEPGQGSRFFVAMPAVQDAARDDP